CCPPARTPCGGCWSPNENPLSRPARLLPLDAPPRIGTGAGAGGGSGSGEPATRIRTRKVRGSFATRREPDQSRELDRAGAHRAAQARRTVCVLPEKNASGGDSPGRPDPARSGLQLGPVFG